MTDIPKKGSGGRKIYDCLELLDKGATTDELATRTGMRQRTVIMRLEELVRDGHVAQDGERSGDLEGLMLPVWKVAKPEPEKVVKKLLELPTPQECPACGETVYEVLMPPEDCRVTTYALADDKVVETFGVKRPASVLVNTRRRIIVFDDSKGTDEGFHLYEEHTWHLVWGRPATKPEAIYLHKTHKLNVPYALGYQGHLMTCDRLDRWLNDKARKKERTMKLAWDYDQKRKRWKKSEPKFKKNKDGDKDGHSESKSVE